MIAVEPCPNCPSDSHFIYLVSHEGVIVCQVFVCMVCSLVRAETKTIHPM